MVGAPVAGQAEYADSLRSRVGQSAGVSLLDPRDDIPEVVADLDVLALPSIEPESYGLVLVEALASGVPVVASDHGGPPEIVARADAERDASSPLATSMRSPARCSSCSRAHTSSAKRLSREPRLTLPSPRFATLFREVAQGQPQR